MPFHRATAALPALEPAADADRGLAPRIPRLREKVALPVGSGRERRLAPPGWDLRHAQAVDLRCDGHTCGAASAEWSRGVPSARSPVDSPAGHQPGDDSCALGGDIGHTISSVVVVMLRLNEYSAARPARMDVFDVERADAAERRGLARVERARDLRLQRRAIQVEAHRCTALRILRRKQDGEHRPLAGAKRIRTCGTPILRGPQGQDGWSHIQDQSVAEDRQVNDPRADPRDSLPSTAQTEENVAIAVEGCYAANVRDCGGRHEKCTKWWLLQQHGQPRNSNEHSECREHEH